MPWNLESTALDCPTCGHQAMTFGERLKVHMFSVRACAHCGVRVALPWWSITFYAPLALPIWFMWSWCSYIGASYGAEGMAGVVAAAAANLAIIVFPILLAGMWFWCGYVRKVQTGLPLAPR